MKISWILWSGIILTFANLLFIFFASVNLKIRITFNKADVNGIAALFINNIIPIHKIKVAHIPRKLTDTEKDKIRNKRTMRAVRYCRVEIINLLKYLKPRVILHNISMKGDIGVGDAYYTAILAPTTAIVINNIIFNCFHNLDSAPIINIVPNFDCISAKGEISCIFKLKIAHSIVMLIKMFKILIKIKNMK